MLSSLESAPWSGEAEGSEWSQFICAFKSPSREKEREGAVQRADEKYLNISFSSVTRVIWNGKFPLLNKSSAFI